MNSVNPIKTAQLNAKLFQLQAAKVEQNNLGFFKKFEEFLKGYDTDASLESFVVGDVFRHRNTSCVPQYHGDNFANWYAKPSKKEVISINFDGMNLAPEYVLPKNMSDPDMQKAAGSKPMNEQQFSLLLYSLIVKPELGRDYLHYELSKEKYYIFHVQLADKMVAVRVRWRGDEWYCGARRFGRDFAWSEGDVFLSLL